MLPQQVPSRMKQIEDEGGLEFKPGDTKEQEKYIGNVLLPSNRSN